MSAAVRDHRVVFYDREEALAGEIARDLGPAIVAGEPAVVLATAAHRRALDAALAASGVDARGAYRFVDADEIASRVLSGGGVDPAVFDEVAGVVRAAVDTGRPVRVYGELVSVLWDAGHVLEAIEIEERWNELLADLPFSLLCAYQSASVAGPEAAGPLHRVCALHAAVVDPPRPARPSHDHRHAVFASVRQFAPDAAAVRTARRFVVDALRAWRAPEGALDDAALVVSELAANAVLHAGSAFVVVVGAVGRLVRVAVHDRSPVPPARREHGVYAQSGRGLDLVSSLAARWGVDRVIGGKAVWAELSV